jgi:uncharacterized membrane protein
MPHLVLSLAVFLGTHIALAENPLRRWLGRVLGERPFLWLYGAIAILQLLWIGWALDAAPKVMLWQPPAWVSLVPLLVMPVALLLLVCGFTQNNPTATMAPARAARRKVTGILAVTRHPVMWGLGLWSLAHLAAVGDAAQALRFTVFAFLALAFLPRIEARQRAKWGEAAWRDFAARSSSVPFLALAQGRARLNWREIGWVRIAAAAALYAALVLGAHEWITGVAVW